MAQIIKFVEDRRVLMACTILSIIMIMAFRELTQYLGAPMFDTLQGGYDMTTVRDFMLIYGEAGRQDYAYATLTLDGAFPLIYGALSIGLLLKLAAFRFLRVLAILPLFLMGLDLYENVQLFSLLMQFPDLTVEGVARASTTTQMKGMAVMAVLAALVFQLLLRIILAAYRQFNVG